MSTTFATYNESHSRPADADAAFERIKAQARAARQARIAAGTATATDLMREKLYRAFLGRTATGTTTDSVPLTYTLATDTESVEFEPHPETETVTVTRQQPNGRWGARETLSLAAGRDEYRRLLRAGFAKW